MRGVRLYLLGPAVFVAGTLYTGSVTLAGVLAFTVMASSHAHLERSSPYIDLTGHEQTLSAYLKDLVKGNAASFAYTLTGVALGYGLVSLARDAAPGLISLPELMHGVAATDMTPTAVLLCVPAVLLLADFFIYAYHRSAHASGDSLRWRMHRRHHSIPVFLLALGARAHPLETLITYALCGLAGGLLGVGLPATLSAGIVMALLMSPHHINCDSELGILSNVLISTDAHRWHHNIDHRESGNFALVFPFWDRLLGTHHEPGRFSGRLGVESESIQGNATITGATRSASGDLRRSYPGDLACR